MATAERRDPLAAFRFRVELDGMIVGGFSEVSGLQAEMETEDYREGGLNSYVHKLPKATKYSNFILKRGLTNSVELWNWFNATANGQIKRRNGSLIVLDASGNESWRWNFSQAYPVKWAGPEFKADSGSIAFESVELVHNGFSKDG